MNFTGDQATSSPHHPFSFKSVIPGIATLPHVLTHVWRPQTSSQPSYPSVHSATLVSQDLPNVNIELFVVMTAQRKLIVHLTKSPAESVNASLTIKCNGNVVKMRDIKDWTHNQIIEELIISQSVMAYNQQLYGDSYSFELTWHGSVKKLNKSPPINLYRHLKCLYETGDLTDFTIAVGDEEISTHKAIIASQSPKLLGMLKSGMRESVQNRLEITHIEPEIMKKVIEFLYTGEIDLKLDVNVLLSVLGVADEYEIIDLKNLCEHILCTKITVNNVLEILEGANLYGAPKLVEETVNLMVYNKKAIVALPDFKDLYNRNPGILLSFIMRIAEV